LCPQPINCFLTGLSTPKAERRLQHHEECEQGQGFYGAPITCIPLSDHLLDDAGRTNSLPWRAGILLDLGRHFYLFKSASSRPVKPETEVSIFGVIALPPPARPQPAIGVKSGKLCRGVKRPGRPNRRVLQRKANCGPRLRRQYCLAPSTIAKAFFIADGLNCNIGT
jgi:hypothetical protein